MDPKNETEIKLILNYPLISKSVQNGMVLYKGILEVNDEDFKISIKQLPGNEYILKLPDKIENLIKDFKIDAVESSIDIITYLDLLKRHLESKIPSNRPENHTEIYRLVLYEYYEFSKFYLNLKKCYLSHDLRKISVTMLDEQNREHHVEIQVNYNDRRNVFEIVEYDLPVERDKFQKSSNLRTVYNQFTEIIERLQPFFNLMEEFDKNCDILDPLPPSKRYNYRRIWLDDKLSMITTVDPFNLNNMPLITFLGPEKLVESYRCKMNQNLEDWDPTNHIYSEVLKLIGLEIFPRKTATEETENHLLIESGGCSICFSLKLNDKLPEIVCKNQCCNNYYHIECLYEWLISINSRTFFNEVVGNCPNCEKNISCPLVK